MEIISVVLKWIIAFGYGSGFGALMSLFFWSVAVRISPSYRKKELGGVNQPPPSIFALVTLFSAAIVFGLLAISVMFDLG